MTAAAPTRLGAIDALRGFALLGILLVNEAAFRLGVSGMMPGGGAGGTAWRTTAVDAAIQWLVAGKFVLIFAFLFGWGVHTQAARGEGFRGRYVRRLMGLLLLGIVHAAFFFAGDILAVYALLGFFMLRPVRRDWPVARLVRSAAILLAVQAVILVGLAAMMAAAPDDDATLVEYARRSAEIYRTGDFWSVTAHRLGEFAAFSLLATLLMLGWGLLAMFRLGLAAAKTFAEGGLEAMRPTARRVLWPALIAGLAANGVCAALTASLPDPWASGATLLQVALAAPILSLAYLAAAVLILSTPAGQRLAPPLATAGRMSLTIYIGQSVIMSLLYHGYGLGLAASLSSAGSVLVCLIVYAALIAFSRLWLGVFRIGPLEWVLRSFTEWRWVALRARSDASAGAAAA
jgi:uncharacterized protein